MPGTSSRYAREGTAAHQLLQDCLEGGFDAEDLLGREYNVEGEIFIVDMDMADAVNTAIAWIRQEIGPDDILMVESGVPIAQLTGETDAEGSADIIGICNGGKTLKVMDYKHGQGVQVYASTKVGQPNGQMGMYGLGALFMLAPIYEDIKTVELFVLQPRMDWFDKFELSVEELMAFGDKVTEAAGRVELNRQVALEGNDLDLVPGEKQCKFCNAKSFCPALRNEVSTAMATVSEANDFDDLTLPKKAASLHVGEHNTPEQLAEAMRAAPLIEDFIKAIRAEVERRLLAGEAVPGFKIVRGKAGNRQWADEKVAEAQLKKRLKADQAYTKKLVTPTQAEKLFKKQPKVWAKIAPLITQSEGGPSVAPADDPRPVLQIASQPEDFQDLTASTAQIETTATIVEEVDPLS
jgi:hypothetical protein